MPVGDTTPLSLRLDPPLKYGDLYVLYPVIGPLWLYAKETLPSGHPISAYLSDTTLLRKFCAQKLTANSIKRLEDYLKDPDSDIQEHKD